MTRKNYTFLGKHRSKIGDWEIDDEGMVGHDCTNQERLWEFGRVKKGFNSIKGKFSFFCVACGAIAPKALELHSQLRRLG